MIFDKIIGPEKTISWALQFWPVLLCSFVVSLGATWLCKKIAIKFGIVDKPDDLVKTHKEPIAYLGGVGIFVGLAVGVMIGIIYLLYYSKIFQYLTFFYQ
jgi:UDP-N-acetylmuramyl pentapeptide phosphotransferase/UDP-N-acetylglucosamine-1-phosphate transferase